ncbi:MAG: T9SS type A sorting domain-containing protein [Legionella sp.]|uniref:T9SS type A sorting domain-containing protein n=1 Tax=Legionella sp. TaxID=459 RepID=UPI00285052C5|nr:T9SS type A sorting domain-containing protein [Legionella sp.]
MKSINIFFCFLICILISTDITNAQWIQGDSALATQSVYDFAVSGTNLFAGTSNGGVFLSTDNGISWNAVNSGLTNTAVFTLAVSGTNIFAGTYGGVFLSTNNGIIWSATSLTNTNVRVLAVSGTNIFAGTYGSAFLSTDNGTSWNAINNGLTNTNIYSIVVSGTNLFAGTLGGGVFLSTNNGTSWATVNTGLTNPNVRVLAVSGTNLFAGTSNGGVFLSTNNGASWTAVNISLTNNEVYAFAFSGTNIFAGTTGSGVFLSTNNGTSWTGFNSGLTDTFVLALAVSGTNIFAGGDRYIFRRLLNPEAPTLVSPSDGATGVSINLSLAWNASNGATSYQLQVSTNSSFSTTRVNLSGITSTSYTINNLANDSTYYWRVNATNAGGTSVWSTVWSFTTIIAIPDAPMLASPYDGATGVSINSLLKWNTSSRATSYRLQASTNSNFSIFVKDKSGITSTSYVDSGFADNTTYYWRVNATNDEGTSAWSTVRSFTTLSVTGHGQWIQTNGPNSGAISSFAVIGTNLFAGILDNGIFLSTDDGTTWNAADAGLTNYNIRSLAVSGTNLIAGTGGGGVFLSTNNGTYWTNIGLTNDSARALAVSDPNLFVATDKGVFLSANNGTNWTAVNTGLTSTVVNCFGISGTKIFAGISNYGIYRSINNGTLWNSSNTGLTNLDVYSIAVSGTNIFAGTYGGGVFHCTDNETSWTVVDTNLTNYNIHALAVSNANIFAGTYGSIFLSTNNGISWTSVNTGLTDKNVTSLIVSGTNIFAGTLEGSVWRRPLSEMVTSVERFSFDLPAQFNLFQNYPNPFNPSTVISYSLPSASNVKLIVYNTLGQAVKVLENGFKNAGNYSVNFNASGLPSGIYFYKIEEGQFSQIKKMILIK